jgi:hypothetical protein
MRKYQELANQIAITPQQRPRVIVFAIGTLGIVPEAILESIRILSEEGIEIDFAALQIAAVIGSVGIAKEVLALPVIQ